MTFCLGMRVGDGLVGIADTRVTSGSEVITARKVTTYQREDAAAFVMTSGLRSARDKALTYFDELAADEGRPLEDRLFKLANLLASQIRRVAEEDGAALKQDGLTFNIHALVGGQMAKDADPLLYLVYPQGSWVEVGAGTPYSIIGASGYGKPVLDRTLKFEDPMRYALKVGCLAFDSTRISAADVGPPIDVILYKRDTRRIVAHRFEAEDLLEISTWWQDRLRQSVRELPAGWLGPLLDDLPPDWRETLGPHDPERYGE